MENRMENRLTVQQKEEQILEFWKKNNIYEKIKKKNSKGEKFYFMDGPPYATGHIHMGTALNKISKDIFMRLKRLQGFDVFDRPGYDTHGVPIEFQIEKEIGSKNKKDIEKYGIKKFIDKCKQYATQYIEVMNNEFINLGVWMDWKNPYLTLDKKYIEAIWWTFKKANEKGLLYLGKYPVHVCPRCETALAYNEIIYGKQKDNSIYVKFLIKGEKDKFLIIWTTTPWTLPGNTGVMVNPEIEYSEVKLDNGEIWIIAKELIPKIMNLLKLSFKIIKTFKGKVLEGLKYENPLSKNLDIHPKKAYEVVLSPRYVNLEEGTGLVHCAPGHGKEDYEVGKEYGLDIISPVEISGNLTKECGKYAGKKARIIDGEIIEDLKKSDRLVYEQDYSHDYPLCWRCKTPLLMISVPQWFFRIKAIHKRLLELNEETNWIPSWMKLRMKAWIEGLSDWPISRKRYWGTPLPIWECNKCSEKKVIGSIDELKKLSGVKKISSLHKPEIDKIKIKCKCGGEMNRIDEVLDVWFDSGVSSWAALDFPQRKDLFKEFWPADLNIEGKDQVRGWWNSQLILSTIAFNKKPFENILEHGMVLDLGKKKMSKSLGNVISPKDIIFKYGRDYLRYYFGRISKGEDFSFDEKEFREIRKILTILQNVLVYSMRAGRLNKINKTDLHYEDLWISSRLNSVIKEATEHLEKYNLPKAVEALENFLVNEVSRGYIQMIRERVDNKEKGALYCLTKINDSLLKLFSPIIPFMTEGIYLKEHSKDLKEESLFLSKWPKADEKLINKEIEEDFSEVRSIIEEGMKKRDEARIGLKWPLSNGKITSKKKLNKEVEDIIKKQLNLKDISSKKGEKIKVELNTSMTPELEAEGFSRELSRKIQVMRKNNGLQKEQEIDTKIKCNKELIDNLKHYIKLIKERTNSKNLELTEEELNGFKNISEEKIKGKSFSIGFNLL